MKIGDTVYKKVLFNGVLSYKVFEIRKQKELVFYAIRCEDCRHYPHCELLITVSDDTKNKPDNEKEYKYVAILNDNEANPQYPVHSTELDNETPFMTDRNEVLVRTRQHYIHALEEERKQIKNKLEDIDTAIKNEQDALSDLKTLLKKENEKCVN